ncbi:MAG TPA: hypothetical protein VHY37_11285, partial [Tepidisphaeraceae bacterium]|nr:hypothetical protein [Tepidisphaeraceae bacterium]
MNRKTWPLRIGAIVIGLASLAAIASDAPPDAAGSSSSVVVPEPQNIGGEAEGIIQVGNLIYAGTKTSKCFSDHFLLQAEQDSTISTSRRLHSVKLADNEV